MNALEITQESPQPSTVEVMFTDGSVNETAIVTLNGTETPSKAA